MVKNEEDLIERFVRINSKVIDRFVIFDDKSSDRTVDILKKLCEEQFRITLMTNNSQWESESLSYRQSDIMNYLRKWVHNDKTEPSDYIFPLDVDEFIFESRESVCNKLQTSSMRFGASSYGAMVWKTFVPVNGELTPDKTLKSVFSPMEKEKVHISKCVIPGYLSLDYKLVMGNHNLTNNQNQCNLHIPLCHFPIRSVHQVISKALITDHKFSMKKNKRPREGYHIRKLARLIRDKNYQLLSSDLVDITFNYLREDNYPQKHLYGSYEVFEKFEEPNLCYTPQTGTMDLTRCLDEFIIELTKHVS